MPPGAGAPATASEGAVEQADLTESGSSRTRGTPSTRRRSPPRCAIASRTPRRVGVQPREDPGPRGGLRPHRAARPAPRPGGRIRRDGRCGRHRVRDAGGAAHRCVPCLPRGEGRGRAADAAPARPGVEPRRAAAARDLQRAVKQALVETLEGLNAPASGLRSRLIRALPTTMAMMALQRRDSYGDRWTGHLLWTGDSRVYVLDPATGATSSPPTTSETPGTRWSTCGRTRS